jgi:hypothetical protein
MVEWNVNGTQKVAWCAVRFPPFHLSTFQALFVQITMSPHAPASAKTLGMSAALV